jgi:hypothetical protein
VHVSEKDSNDALARRLHVLWRQNDEPPHDLSLQRECTVLLVRGLFGAWIPGHFHAPLARLQGLGWDARIARTDPAGTIAANAALLAPQLEAVVAAGRRPLLLAHSKGGLEVLLALATNERLARATAGVVTVQMPRAGAPYLESVFLDAHRASRSAAGAWREASERVLLTLAGARGACAELNGDQVAALAARLDAQAFAFPWIGIATHCTAATRSLELKHERLSRIRPGQPHDGVFFLDDQQWPRAAMLTLDGIDHAQPSVGGAGFAHDRFWSSLLALVATA